MIDGKRNGKGTDSVAGNGVYEGDFVDDKRTGKGISTYVNGDFYEGDWVEGERVGRALINLQVVMFMRVIG